MQYNFRGTFDPAQNYVAKDVVSFTQNGITKYFFCLNPVYNTNPQPPSISGDTNSWGIINALSNFPNSVDSFLFRSSISGSDKINIARINELTLKTSLTADEQDELNYLIAQNRNKLFLADDLNAIQDSLSNLQLFFKDKIESYINSSINDITIARDYALNSIETKKANIDTYLDSTSAGELRVDIGVMGDLTTTNKHSLVEALNETRENTQAYKLTADDGKVKTLALNTDLNTIKSSGFYFVVGTTLNSPFNDEGFLEVLDYGTNVSQTVIQRYSRNSNSDIWERTYKNSNWTGWVKLASNAEAQMIKITSDTGAAKLNAYSNTDDILAFIIASGVGLHSFYASALALNKPTSDSIRGFAHITGINPTMGYVQAYDYHGNSFTNSIYDGVWQGWRQLNSNKDEQTILWSGVYTLGLDASGFPQKVTPNKPLSKCKNGWVLVWSDYNAGVGENNFDFSYSYIPKFIVTKHSDTSTIFPIANYMSNSAVSVTAKKMGVYDEYLLGHSDNKESANQSNDVVLRYVLEW